MPGDGVSNDVMQAARLVLDARKFDAQYVPADIGWEFWCKEGNPLNYLDDIDLVVFRENTEGSYGGVEWLPLPEHVRRSRVRLAPRHAYGVCLPGASHEQRVDVPKGDPRDPMTEEEIAVKFNALAQGVVTSDVCFELRELSMNIEKDPTWTASSS